MEHTISLPVKFLAALRLLTSDKKERRTCLRGVAIKEGMLMATNGNYAGVIDLQKAGIDASKVPEVIFPNEIIDLFVKKIGRSNLAEAQVDIVWEDDGGKTLKFLSPTAIEIGRIIDDSVYPDVRRVLNEKTKPEGFVQFPWYQLALFEKAADILRPKRNKKDDLINSNKPNLFKTIVIPNENSAARVLLTDFPAFNGAIMPIAIDVEAFLIENGFTDSSVEDLV